MAKMLSDTIMTDIKELINKITGFEIGSAEFNNAEKYVTTTLKKSDSMYFLKTKDIDKEITSMAQKFMFHGFFRHAERLKLAHDKYIDKSLSESELTPKLNVVKFLLCMSESPTTNFWKYPEKFDFLHDHEEEGEEEIVDWGAYLNEDIERWSPVNDESFDHSDIEDTVEYESTINESSILSSFRPVITEKVVVKKYDFQACREMLNETIQNEWFNQEPVIMKPVSRDYDANVGLLWENHLKSEVKGLIEIKPVSVISEYKVLREILWQMWGPHNSTVFELSDNKLVPKTDITISSVRSEAFEEFLQVFVPYIEQLQEFRRFCASLESNSAPQTYHSYANAVHNIVKPVFSQLTKLEDEIREQETSFTLLKLAGKLEIIFEPVQVLKIIHDNVIEDFTCNSSLFCSLTLLTRLRHHLQFSQSKLEQDICLSLYLNSLYYYLTMVYAWLVKNDLVDQNQEFVILNENENNNMIMCDDWNMNFFLQESVEEFSERDGIIRLICDQVLQIGRNIHLLHLLGKFDVIAKGPETIHEEFVRRILEEMCHFYNVNVNNREMKSSELSTSVSLEINEIGDWTNFVDVSDGFLTKAFENFYTETIDNDSSHTSESLFEKINKISINLFPLQQLPEKIFSEILKEKFTISGLVVKNMLIENYHLDKQFEFLSHTFLFHEDLIFPFHRRLFERMNIAGSNWGNSIWLTAHLQDVIMDIYPNFYEKCTVQVKDHWKECRDSLEACTLISIKYVIEWPLNLIITANHIKMYTDSFQFLLKIKWALYTINRLSFTDLKPKRNTNKKEITKSTTLETIIKRLKYLRFSLINIMNSIQHYVFGFVFNKCRMQFELDFEKANDLRTLITAHENFINSIHRAVMEIRDCEGNGENGFKTLMKSVKMLKVMWNKMEHASFHNLNACYDLYKKSFKIINSLVNPVYIFDY